tara:strand:- start:1510 stop:1680 length:171 start_codon:yes stop_codon:yes gene_type:complete
MMGLMINRLSWRDFFSVRNLGFCDLSLLRTNSAIREVGVLAKNSWGDDPVSARWSG